MVPPRAAIKGSIPRWT